MRAPGAVSGMFALECAMDELAYALKIDPLELRLINYAEVDPESGKPLSSKALRECYRLGAEKFGWKDRKPEPRSMRDGRLLVGWGMATGVWGAFQRPANARITLRADGTAHVVSATSDIGPGTYTVMTMIAAEYLGLTPEQVKFELGDTNFPRAPSQGGSQTTSSVGSAVYGAALAVGARLLALANQAADSPLKAAADSDVEMLDGRLRLKSDPSRFVSVAEVMRRNGLTEITETFESKPSKEREKYALLAHGAQFVEVKVDPDLGTVRVTRAIEVTACGKIINPKASHSQEIGGVVWGIGMALQEATEIDHRYGRIMNPNLQHYHVPVNADIHSDRDDVRRGGRHDRQSARRQGHGRAGDGRHPGRDRQRRFPRHGQTHPGAADHAGQIAVRELESKMNEVRALVEAFDAANIRGERCALATVVSVEGSSYRRPGARMLVCESGLHTGTISAGCLESDVIEHAKRVLQTGAAKLVEYNTATTSDEEIWGLGLGCNGIVRVLIEPLASGSPCIEALRRSCEARPDAAPISVATVYDVDGAAKVFIETLLPPVPLVIFGAGQDALPVVELARELGWTHRGRRSAGPPGQPFPVCHRRPGHPRAPRRRRCAGRHYAADDDAPDVAQLRS